MGCQKIQHLCLVPIVERMNSRAVRQAQRPLTVVSRDLEHCRIHLSKRLKERLKASISQTVNSSVYDYHCGCRKIAIDRCSLCLDNRIVNDYAVVDDYAAVDDHTVAKERATIDNHAIVDDHTVVDDYTVVDDHTVVDDYPVVKEHALHIDRFVPRNETRAFGPMLAQQDDL